nr:MAG TPA: hypothetical protein [Caudoviricetes sp.]
MPMALRIKQIDCCKILKDILQILLLMKVI